MPPHPKTSDFPALLDRLTTAGVEFIVVGGAACVIHGAPITTIDLDIVHRRTPGNVERLLKVLLEIDATFRFDFTDRRLRPTAEMLAGTGQLNLSTEFGPLDPLCQLHDGKGYEELLRNTQLVTDQGHELRVLDLPTLIVAKTQAGRPKDRLVLPILIAILQERENGTK